MIALFLNKKMNLNIIIAHASAVLIFSILYYLQDIFISKHEAFSLRFGLLDKSKIKERSFKSTDYWYYLWYSMITQTTIGYAGVLNSETGKPVSWVQQPNRVFKTLNILQMIGIILVPSFY